MIRASSSCLLQYGFNATFLLCVAFIWTHIKKHYLIVRVKSMYLCQPWKDATAPHTPILHVQPAPRQASQPSWLHSQRILSPQLWFGAWVDVLHGVGFATDGCTCLVMQMQEVLFYRLKKNMCWVNLNCMCVFSLKSCNQSINQVNYRMYGVAEN